MSLFRSERLDPVKIQINDDYEIVVRQASRDELRPHLGQLKNAFQRIGEVSSLVAKGSEDDVRDALVVLLVAHAGHFVEGCVVLPPGVQLGQLHQDLGMRVARTVIDLNIDLIGLQGRWVRLARELVRIEQELEWGLS